MSISGTRLFHLSKMFTRSDGDSVLAGQKLSFSFLQFALTKPVIPCQISNRIELLI